MGIEAAETVRASAFDVTFDSVMSLGRSRRKPPLVLRAGPDANRLIEFHRILYDALVKAGLRLRRGHGRQTSTAT